MDYNMRNPGMFWESAVEPRVGYAFVKPQRLGKVYPPKRALAEGTIFPELNITMHEYTRGIRDGK
ncbi:MAG: spore coat associated protein CotJA [Oscillospiraceae bacterium]|nr:spore coat associated protein CotJA [Oscillospiraceae bacterium]